MAARVLLSSGAGIKFLLQWSRHSYSDFRRTAILPASFYNPFCATEGYTYRKFSNNCALKSYNSSHSEPQCKMDPADKVSLVTGGASGIGLAICKELLQNKVKGVAICDIDAKVGQQRLQELTEKYGQGRVIFIESDVRSYQQLEEAFQRTIESFGTVDIVVNNAGILDESEWEKEVDINLNGVIRGLLLSFQYMGQNNNKKGGVVVNIASISGLDPYEFIPIYGAIKHGIVGLTKAFGMPRHFNRTGVRVVAMCPGTTVSSIGTNGTVFFDKEWKTILDRLTFQPVECVSQGVLQIIREAPNGSIWVSEKEKPSYQVIIPSRQSLMAE